MSIVEDIKKIEGETIALYLGATIATIAPGFLTIYLYKPDLIDSLESIKLAIFSLSLGLPLFAANGFLTMLVSSIEDEVVDYANVAGTSALVTSIAFYSSLLNAYFNSCLFKEFVVCLVCVNAAVYILLYIFLHYLSGSKKH